MIIYIDSDFKCHTINDGTMQSVETDAFNGKCEAFTEGYRFVPEGETWVREDGTAFHGEMIAPWKTYEELERAQAQYEHDLLAEVTAQRDRLLDEMQALIDEVLGGEGDV